MLLRNCRLVLVVLVVLAVSPFFRIGTAHAIPAFSRLHKTECSTCHTIYPELNEFGEAFRKLNYVYPGKKKGAPTAGEEAAKEGKGAGKDADNEWAFLSGLPLILPVSLTGTLDLAYDEDAFQKQKLQLSARSLRLQAGGTFRDLVAFYITYNLYTQGLQTGTQINSLVNNTNTPPNNTPNISEMYAVWNQAFGSPLNLKVGRMEPSLSLWKRSNKVLTVPAYASTAYLVGNSPFSLDAPEDAAEINAVLFNRLFVAGGAVNRNGQNHYDGYGSASFKFGGTDYKGNEPEIDLDKESIWDYLAITWGVYGYSGRNGQFDNLGIVSNFNDFYRVGSDIDILYKRLHVKGSGVFGNDSNPQFSTTPVSFDSHAYTFEAEYYLGAPINVIPLFRYEYQSSLQGGIHRYIPGIAYTPLQNTKLTLEYIYTDAPEGRNRTTVAALAFSL
ncbi:porin [Geomonas sp.]|uniref:porin n=1 Tax=Geomonas sp. TaxID=2651584 RepID=UPI002B49F9C8|nr:porin [Geomonas sp.]HJV34173.1 porin [Geomonas sp.]